jgi:metallo-beta-lactamase family protein
VFSGDVGRDNDALMYPTQAPKADYVFLESTYGNRISNFGCQAGIEIHK